jgi:hypothetical protein
VIVWHSDNFTHTERENKMYTLISLETKTHINTHSFVISGAKTGETYEETHAWIAGVGPEPRRYQVSLHAGCEGEGYRFYTMEQYSNQGRCTGCDLSEYNGIGD